MTVYVSRFRVLRLASATALVAIALAGLLFVSGCGGEPGSSPSDPNARSDRELIEAQGACPVTGKKLGSMGAPVKVTVGGKPVFLCCKACKEEALENPDKTLAKVKELQAEKP